MRVVCLGGGTGLSMILRGLKRHRQRHGRRHHDRRRRQLRPPAPRLRHARPRRRPPLPVGAGRGRVAGGQLFEHRFTTGELAGHTFGNLFLAGLTDYLGSFDRAVSESARVLAVAGRVVPSTTDMVELVAEMRGRPQVRGETALAADGAASPPCDWIRPIRAPIPARCRRSRGQS